MEIKTQTFLIKNDQKRLNYLEVVRINGYLVKDNESLKNGPNIILRNSILKLSPRDQL